MALYTCVTKFWALLRSVLRPSFSVSLFQLERGLFRLLGIRSVMIAYREHLHFSIKA